LPVRVVIDDGRGATNGECGRQNRVRLQSERWFNFLCQFITQKKEPATSKRQFLSPRPAKLALPPGIQCREESALVLPASRYTVGTEFNSVSGKSEQDVETTQRWSRRRALQHEWVTLRSELMQCRQIDRLRQGAYVRIFVAVPPVHGVELRSRLER